MPSPVQWLSYQLNSISKRLTLGVRGVVLDKQNRVFLVRHSYVAGWYMPGGGVEPGETLAEALARELREEGNIEVSGEPSLHGMFLNRGLSNRDHVAVFIVREFEQTSRKAPDLEILEADFFDLGHLPEGTTAPTRRRLAEVLEGAKRDQLW